MRTVSAKPDPARPIALPDPIATDPARLAERSRLLFKIRTWFQGQGFIEVETPVRVAAPPPEVHIDAFRSEDAFLRPSPELHLKQLVAGGAQRIYELGPCFRRGERGALHNPEYTMLEWYRAGTDYRGVLDDTRELLRHLAPKPIRFRGQTIDFHRTWQEITVSEAFRTHAGWDPVANYDADRFDVDTVNKVLPALAADVPVVLMDYPAEAAALARCAGQAPAHAERWELLIGGLELANAYSELCDAAEQRRRFAQWNDQRSAAGREEYPWDEAFLAALDRGLPPCGGVALGIDRLLMVMLDADTIGDVRPFCTPSPEIA